MKRTRSYVVLGTALLLSGCLLFTVNWADAVGSERISFASNRIGNFNINVMDTNGENLRNLTDTPARELAPAWSPDGRFLAYISRRDGDRRIYVMDTKTRNTGDSQTTTRANGPRRGRLMANGLPLSPVILKICPSAI